MDPTMIGFKYKPLVLLVTNQVKTTIRFQQHQLLDATITRPSKFCNGSPAVGCNCQLLNAAKIRTNRKDKSNA